MSAMMEVADDEQRAKLEQQLQKQKDDLEKKRLQLEAQDGFKYVTGNMYSFVQKLVSQYRRSLQNIDPNTPDYVRRLRDEARCVDLVSRAQQYYTQINKTSFLAKVVLLRLELIYYHYHPELDALANVVVDEEADVAAAPAAEKRALPKFNLQPKTSSLLLAGTPIAKHIVHQLATFLYKHGDNQQRTRGVLLHVYFLATHNCFESARDLVLSSHVQDMAAEGDAKARILFNRAMAALGLAAFRTQHHKQALYALADLHQSNRIKELLAQGISNRFGAEKEGEKEKIERRKLPYHMHLNLDMLESVHLLTAMFVEVPNIAVNGLDKRKIISKAFRRFLENHQKQAFNGPPENTRESVMAATKALQMGDWQRCFDVVRRLRMWEVMPHAEKVLARLKHTIKELALKTYLLNYGCQYRSVSLSWVSRVFGLSRGAAWRLCSKLMVDGLLKAAWDQPNDCIRMHAAQPTRLQRAATDYVDKLGAFVEQNERLVEQRFGGYYKAERSGLGGAGGAGERVAKWFDSNAISSSFSTWASSYGAANAFSFHNFGKTYENFRKNQRRDSVAEDFE